MSGRNEVRLAARTCAALALLSLLSTAVAAEARAQVRALDEAREADRQGDIERARGAYERALAEGRSGRDELAEIHVRLGVLCAAMGEPDRGREHLRVALALTPELAAPRDLAPAQITELDALRRERAGRPLRAEIASPPSHVRGTDLSLAIEARDAGGAGVARMRLRIEPLGFERVVPGVGPATVVVPAQDLARATPIAIELALLDAHGGALATRRVTVEVREPIRPAAAPIRATAPRPGPLAPSPPRRAPPSSGARSSWLESPWLWLAVGVAVAGGVTVGVVAAAGEGDRVSVGAPVIE